MWSKDSVVSSCEILHRNAALMQQTLNLGASLAAAEAVSESRVLDFTSPLVLHSNVFFPSELQFKGFIPPRNLVESFLEVP